MRSNTASTLLFTGFALVSCTTAAPPPVDAATIDANVFDASLGSPTIVLAGGGSLVAVAGDVLRLDVVLVSPSGVHSALPADAMIEWTSPASITALASGSTPGASHLPPTTTHPTAFFLQNREHYTDAQLAGVLIVTDSGATGSMLTVDAHITSASIDANISANIPVGAVPGGDAATGQTFYTANCASCHGARGEGAAARGLNHASGNVAADSNWSAATFASVVRVDIDELGVSEDPGMPTWLVTPTESGAFLRTQDMVDVYAWLLTQD